jgi:hypothetical protein
MGNSIGGASRSESAKFERRKAILAKMIKNHNNLKSTSGDGFEKYVESDFTKFHIKDDHEKGNLSLVSLFLT